MNHYLAKYIRLSIGDVYYVIDAEDEASALEKAKPYTVGDTFVNVRLLRGNLEHINDSYQTPTIEQLKQARKETWQSALERVKESRSRRKAIELLEFFAR